MSLCHLLYGNAQLYVIIITLSYNKIRILNVIKYVTPECEYSTNQ